MDSQRQRTSGDQAIPPLSFSPTGDHLTAGYGINNSGEVPNISRNINAHGTIIIEEDDKEYLDSESGKKRGSEEGVYVEGEKAVKKKRRQEKNREAAQLFRQRQKAKVHELERSVDELTCNNSEYRMKMEILVFENKILKDQLFYLKNLVSSGILITSVPNIPSFPPMPVMPAIDKADAPALVLNHSLGRAASPLVNTNNGPVIGNNNRAPLLPTNNSAPMANSPLQLNNSINTPQAINTSQIINTPQSTTCTPISNTPLAANNAEGRKQPA